MFPMRLGYKELGLELVEPLQDHLIKSRRPPMADEKKDEGLGDPIQMLLRRSPRATKECDDGQLFPDPSAITQG